MKRFRLVSFMKLRLLVALLLVLAFASCASNQNQDCATLLKKVECEKYAERTRQEYRETGSLMPGGAAPNKLLRRTNLLQSEDGFVPLLTGQQT